MIKQPRQKRSAPEEKIQEAVARHLNERAADGVVWWHTPNGGKRHVSYAVKLKKLGLKPGVPDIIAVYRGHNYALELKAPGGRASVAQREMLAALDDNDWFTAICEGLDPALRVLESWGLIKGRTQ